MMPLVSELTLDEVREEIERFDFLNGVRENVTKAMELHRDEDCDSEYVFVFWFDDASVDSGERIKKNIEMMDRQGWSYSVDDGPVGGIVIVRTWI